VTLDERFLNLLQRYVSNLTIRGRRVVGLCPFHPDRHPSFSADLEKCVWFCFPCNRGGGVKAFAIAVGEEWSHTRNESQTTKARRVRFQAEQQARTILARRAEERDRALCAAHRERYGAMLEARDLLSLFHWRPDLAEEFPGLVSTAERKYGETLFQLSVLEARLDGEVA